MRILIPTVDYPPIEGGIGTVTLEVSRELAALGHRVTVVAPWFAGMDDSDAAEPVQVLRFRGYRSGWLRWLPLYMRCRRRLRDTDLIIAPNVAYGGVIGLFSGVPFITFAYAYEFLKFQRVPPLANLLRRVYLGADVVVAISSFTRARLTAFGVPERRITTILPGARAAAVDVPDAEALRRQLGVSASRYILSVGRLIARKNHAALLEAMPSVLERFPDVQLVIVGQGPEECALRTAATQLHGMVVFTGKVSDPELHALYQDCAMFALPTRDAGGGQVEGFGLVFSEAHAWGKPVVAGRGGGVDDAVIDGVTGILVEPTDIRELARALIRLLEYPDEATTMGDAGRARVMRELNWTVFTRSMLDAREADR